MYEGVSAMQEASGGQGARVFGKKRHPERTLRCALYSTSILLDAKEGFRNSGGVWGARGHGECPSFRSWWRVASRVNVGMRILRVMTVREGFRNAGGVRDARFMVLIVVSQRVSAMQQVWGGQGARVLVRKQLASTALLLALWYVVIK